MLSSLLKLRRRNLGWWLLGALAGAPACGSSDDDVGTGGASAVGGDTSSGSGGASIGGRESYGGRPTGGALSSGGASGGTLSDGGTATGGAESLGGAVAGGSSGTGGGGDGCLEVTEPKAPQAARSFGFSGTDSDYSLLYDDLCVVPSDCVPPCMERGGTEEFCSASICIDYEPDYCLPPTKWRGVEGALSKSDSIEYSAVTSLSLSNGADHDRLILDDFEFDVPSDATIVGISATIHHAGGGAEEASDQVVRIVKGGVIGETGREKPGYWPLEITPEPYGGPDDLWGETWTPADVNSESFGLAIAALPADSGGRAYVDVAYLEVHYRPAGCDE